MKEDGSKIECLVYCLSPTHVISSVCAMETLHSAQKINATLLIYRPGEDQEVKAEVYKAFKNLTKEYLFVKKLVLINDSFLSDEMALSKNVNPAEPIADFGTSIPASPKASPCFNLLYKAPPPATSPPTIAADLAASEILPSLSKFLILSSKILVR